MAAHKPFLGRLPNPACHHVLPLMYGVCLLWSSNTQDHTLRKSTRVSHGNAILVSPFGQHLSFPIWTSLSQYPDLDYALMDTRIYTKYHETPTHTHPHPPTHTHTTHTIHTYRRTHSRTDTRTHATHTQMFNVIKEIKNKSIL